jgi:hypothetical protein
LRVLPGHNLVFSRKINDADQKARAARRLTMLTRAMRIVLVLMLVVAATLGHLARMLGGFDFGLAVLALGLVGPRTAIPPGALALKASAAPVHGTARA